MSDINFTIRKVFPGTEKQKAVGINATFNMTIDGPDGIIANVNDMKLMKSQEGKYYVDSPFRTFDGTDPDGKPKKVKINYIKFFPEKEHWDKQNAIVNLVLAELQKAPNTSPSSTNGMSSKPTAATTSKPVVKTASNEVW